MPSRLLDIFNNERLSSKIATRLPYLFQIAEIECSRGGKIGMEVGNLRERMIVALLAHSFGDENIDSRVPTTDTEVDVKLFGEPVSIKTITNTLAGVKLIWTVDYGKVKQFYDEYRPKCDMLLAHIVWNGEGGFCYIPKEAQKDTFDTLGKQGYLRLPKQGTNPRGVEISKNALETCLRDNRSRTIPINWIKVDTDYDPYLRWLQYWNED